MLSPLPYWSLPLREQRMKYEIHIIPLAQRQAIIKKALEAPFRTDRLDDFRGEPIELKVVSLEAKLLVYRLANCRTFSEQHNVIAKYKLDPSFFANGQESTRVQIEQHKILRKLTKNAKASIANIDEVLDLEGQRESLLITSSGVVVNGNRRLSAMRELHASDSIRYNGFSHVKCAVLPPYATSDDIDDVEATLQARPQTKLDYDWIGEAQLVSRQLEKNRSYDEVAFQLRRKPQEIKNLLHALKEAELYLSEWHEKPGHYSLVIDDGEQLFKDIPKQIASQDTQLQNASRAIAWSIFENADKFAGRIYNYNTAFGKHAQQVVDSVTEGLGIELSATNEAVNGEFEVAIEEDEQVTDYLPFIQVLKDQETKDVAVELLVDACVTAIEQEKGKKKKDAALNSLAQIYSKLMAIDISMAGKSTYEPMVKQIRSIEDRLQIIGSEIKNAMKSGQPQAKDD